MQTVYHAIDQTRDRMRRSPCRTCGEDTLHRGTICIHCNTNALAIPADAVPRPKFDAAKRRANWRGVARDRRAATRAAAEASRQKWEGK